jgi:hypothetical protein
MALDSKFAEKALELLGKQLPAAALFWLGGFGVVAAVGKWRYCSGVEPNSLCSFAKDNAWLVGGTAVVIALFLGKVTDKLYELLKDKRLYWGMRRKGLRHLRKHLLEDEKRILRMYMDEGVRSKYFHIEHGAVRALENVFILVRVSEIGRGNMQFPFAIQPWIVAELRKHPHLLS